jgi:hypothetical protein
VLPKRYGQSQTTPCFFCGRAALAYSAQRLPVCEAHRQERADDLVCACGERLQVKDGKYGVFLLCANCGPVSLKKYQDSQPNGADVKRQGKPLPQESESRPESRPREGRSREDESPREDREQTINSDDPRFFD